MIKKYLIPISLLLLLTACCKDDDNEPTVANQRTVMVYMAAYNNLSNYSDSDISQMEEGASGIPRNNTMVLFVDKKKDENPFIAKLTGKKDAPLDTLYRYSSKRPDSDPAVFREALQKMIELCPAEEYGLVLWGHGTGWVVTKDSVASKPSSRAYGIDYSNWKWMNITQMAEALKGFPKMKYIFADCCHMACAEVAYELRDNTEYLIGSPAEIPGRGAPYDQMVRQFFDTSDAFYKRIIDTYYDYYADDKNLNSAEKTIWPYILGAPYSVPLAAINTAHTEPLALMTSDAICQAEGGYPTYPATPDFSGIAYYMGYDFPMMYDMRAFIERIAPASVFTQWDAVYRQAVPYYRMSMKWMTEYDGRWISGCYYPRYYDLISDFDTFDSNLSYGCVSMFIPKPGKGYDEGDYCYNQNACHFAWNKLMEWNNYGWTQVQP